MSSPEENAGFLCPECGSQDAAGVVLVSTVPSDDDPWSAVLERITCARCESVIPAHLAELWDGMLPEEAVKEWRDVYRNSMPRDDN
jgi:hypothetical protein